MRCSRCFSTVLMLMPSSAAVSLLALPSAMSWSTSISREVRRALARLRPSGAVRRLAPRVGRSRLAIEGLKNVFPFWTSRIASAHVVGGGLFEQKSHRAGLGRVLDIRVITVRGEDEHLGGGDGFEHLAGGFQTVEPRHGDVHQHHGGTKLLGQGDRLAAVLRFADHFEVGFQFQHLAKPLAHDRVVFGQQDGDSFHRDSKFGSS